MSNRALLQLLFCASLVDLAVNMPGTILPLVLLSHGYSSQQAATAMFVPLAVALVMTLPSGAVVDRFGQRRCLLVSMLGLAATTAVLAATYSVESVEAVVGLRAAFAALFMTASFAASVASADPKQRLYGVTWLAMAVTVSFSIGPALSMLLWQHGVGLQQFLACGALCGLASLGVPRIAHIPRSERGHVKRPALQYAAWLAPLLFCMAVSSIGGVNSTLAIIGLHARGLNGGFFFSGTAVGMLLARLPSAAIVHRYGPVTAAALLVMLMLAGGTMVALATSEPFLVSGAILMGAAWSSMLPACSSLLLAASSPETRGRVMAAYAFAMALGGAIGGAGAARFSASANGYATALAVACMLPPVALAYLIASQRRRRPTQAYAVMGASE